MMCERCRKRQKQLRRGRKRRYYAKNREKILERARAHARTPEHKAKRKAHDRAYYLKNRDRKLAKKARDRDRKRAKLERDRQFRKTNGPQINADRRTRQVSKWRKYREAEKNDSRIIMPPQQCAAALLARLQEHHA